MTEPTTIREIERKFRVHALYRLPELAGSTWAVASIDQLAPRSHVAVYHDTSDLRLFRWGVTLRRRTGGTDAGWHLKLPVDGAEPGVRDELQVPLDLGEVGDVPGSLRSVVSALTRGAALAPVVTVTTERQPYLLLGPAGHPVAELVDDHVSIRDGDRTVSAYREIEVEALADASGTLDGDAFAEVVAILVASGAEPSTMSKAASALGPAVAAPPDVPEPEWPSRRDPAAAAVSAYLRLHVRRLVLNDVRFRRDLPDAVHQLRVAARRLRSGLRTFRPLVDPAWADDLRRELAWLADELGGARDAEVLMERLDTRAASLSPDLAARARGAIDPWLRSRMDDAMSRARAALDSPRHAALLQRLVDAAATPPLLDAAAAPCRDCLPGLVSAAYRPLAARVRTIDSDGPAEDWHRARILGKRARYAAEFAAEVLGEPTRSLAIRLEALTEALGEHQDAHVAQATIAELVRQPGVDPVTGFALGLVHAEERQRELAARRSLDRLWRVIAKSAHRAGADRDRRGKEG